MAANDNPTHFGTNATKAQEHVGFDVKSLFSIITTATVQAKSKLQQIHGRRSAISIADMFEMQMLMNHLSQVSEMSTNVVASSNSAIQSMSRNVK